MTIPALPEAKKRRVELGGVAFLTEPHIGCVTNEEARAYGESCYRAGMERGAVICEETGAYTEEIDMAQDCAAAIRAEAAKEAK